MEGDRHANIQHMALVDSHREISTVIHSQTHSYLNVSFSRIVSIHFLHFRWDYVQDGTTVRKDMDRLTAFYKGLNTWARWVDSNIDTSKTKVFFQGISPTHYQLVILALLHHNIQNNLLISTLVEYELIRQF